MPIKKRVKVRYEPKIKKIRRSPKQRKHYKECKRLLALVCRDDDDSLLQAMSTIVGFDADAHMFIEHVMARASTHIETLQDNGPFAKGATYRVCMTYTDREKPMVNGRYPRKAVVKSSTRIVHSLMLCYIELCKHIGRFI